MAISVDSLSLLPAAPILAQTPARVEAVAPVGQREGASNDRRNAPKDRERAVNNFRAALNAATLRGLTQAISRDSKPAENATDEPARARERPAKLPDAEPTVLSGAEAANLFRSAQAADQSSSSEFRAATSRYAKSFFSVSGTFAKPGESLELTA